MPVTDRIDSEAMIGMKAIGFQAPFHGGVEDRACFKLIDQAEDVQ